MSVALPELHVCKVENDCLTIPSDLRAKYIACPIRAPEWRILLQRFDQSWGVGGREQPVPRPSTQQPSSAQPSAAAAADAGAPERGDGDEELGDESPPPSWDSIFMDEPKTSEAFHQKYGAGAHKFAIDNNVAGIVAEGPKLFMVASAEAEYETDVPILCFGAGVWLLDQKAERFLNDRV